MSEARRSNESYSAVVERLAASQKSNRGAPAYSRFVNRPIGRRLAAVSYRAGLTPNAVTGVSAAFSAAAIVLLATISPSPLLGLGIGMLLVIGYGLDAADGQLARLTGGGSLSGEWLDHMVDCVKASTLHLAVAVSFYRYWDLDAAWLLVPIALTVLDSTEFFGQILAEQLKRSRGTSTATGSPSPVVSLLKMPTDYGVLCLTFLLFGVRGVFLAVYTAIAITRSVYLIAALPRWYGQLKALDRGETAT